METNKLGFVASVLFVFVPTVFLLILYIQTASKKQALRCLPSLDACLGRVVSICISLIWLYMGVPLNRLFLAQVL
ncbi:MAG: photosystem II reaction center protein M [Phormidesmis sp. RL_2_1]|nr:photosystem II reaction center protein M [Phormidesmis sp. RL_2_1]